MYRAAFILIFLMAPWFSILRAQYRPIEKREEPKVEFIGEKTGQVEDDLKKALIAVLENNMDAQRAYLAMISTDGKKSWRVALCLSSKRSDETLIQELGAVFRRIFGKDQFLDMMFLTAETEQQLQKVCPAFYSKKLNQSPQPTAPSSRG